MHFSIWTNTFSNFRQIHLAISDKYILQFGLLHFAIWTNTLYNFHARLTIHASDQSGQDHLASKATISKKATDYYTRVNQQDFQLQQQNRCSNNNIHIATMSVMIFD